MKHGAWKIGAQYVLVGVLVALAVTAIDGLAGQPWWLRWTLYLIAGSAISVLPRFVPALDFAGGKARAHDWVGVVAAMCLCLIAREDLSGAFAAIGPFDGVMAGLMWVVAPLTALVVCARTAARVRARSASRRVVPEPQSS